VSPARSVSIAQFGLIALLGQPPAFWWRASAPERRADTAPTRGPETLQIVSSVHEFQSLSPAV